jgi:HSP20 family protein
MANIEVRKNGETGGTIAPAREQHYSPFRMMRELMNWDPFREMIPVIPDQLAEFAPAFDVKETKDAYVFKADVPGVKDADLEVTVTGNRLTISGKREETKEDKGDRYYTYERNYGSFTRSFTLPEGVDTNSTQADLKDGVLTLSIHKTPQAQAKKIPVQTAAKKS